MIYPTKAIIAVAGYGTRRLPIAKAVEKCMLPLLNRPVVDYVVEECIKAGVTDIYFVVSRDSRQLQSYYSSYKELEDYLTSHGQESLLNTIAPPANVTFHYITQDHRSGRYGTSVPLWLAREAVKDDELFYLLAGDNCLYSDMSELRILAEEMTLKGAHAGMMGVPTDKPLWGMYGAITCDERHFLRHIKEKPTARSEPSNLINPSMYLLSSAILPYIQHQMSLPPQGEDCVTEAINQYVCAGGKVSVAVSSAKYLNCGTLEHWVEANRWLLAETLKLRAIPAVPNA